MMILIKLCSYQGELLHRAQAAVRPCDQAGVRAGGEAGVPVSISAFSHSRVSICVGPLHLMLSCC